MLWQQLTCMALCLLGLSSTVHALSAAEISIMETSGLYTFTDNGDYYTIESDGLPKNADGTVNYDTTFAYNGGNGVVTAQSYVFQIPKNPSNSSIQYCTPMGVIAFRLDNAVYYNMWTLRGTDANEDDMMMDDNMNSMMGMMWLDDCHGHPDAQGRYHTHGISCAAVDEFVAVALDGYPIYGPVEDADGNVLSGAELGLDACHGRLESVTDANGDTTDEYRYRMTPEAPYIVGCYWGDKLYKTTSQPYTRSLLLKVQEYNAAADTPTTCELPTYQTYGRKRTEKKGLLGKIKQVVEELNELDREEQHLAEKKENLEREARLVVKEALKAN